MSGEIVTAPDVLPTIGNGRLVSKMLWYLDAATK
jgi:hypothetical protein